MTDLELLMIAGGIAIIPIGYTVFLLVCAACDVIWKLTHRQRR